MYTYIAREVKIAGVLVGLNEAPDSLERK